MTLGEYLRYLFLLLFFPRSLKTMEWRMLRLVNKDRKKHRLAPLRMQEDLRTVARRHSRDMARKDYFEHINPEGKSPADRLKFAKITDVTSGENLAKIGGYRNPTQFAEEGLMNSPGHRANILYPLYNTVGIGIIRDLRKIYYFTQNFAKRDVIFYNKFPDTIPVRKVLKLKGGTFSSVDSILYQVKLSGHQHQVLQKTIVVQNGQFCFQISFPHAGRFEISIFSHKEGKKPYILSNKFEVRVFMGFWG